MFGARTLLVREAEARPKLLTMVESNLLAEHGPTYGQSNRLHAGIRVLAEMDRSPATRPCTT